MEINVTTTGSEEKQNSIKTNILTHGPISWASKAAEQVLNLWGETPKFQF